MTNKLLALTITISTSTVLAMTSAAIAGGNYDSPQEHYDNYVYETPEEHYDHVVYESPAEHYDHVNYQSPADTYNSKVW